MNIVPGLYAATKERVGKTHSVLNVIGVSTNTETAERCVLCQIRSGPLSGVFRHIPVGQFSADVKKFGKLLEPFNTPRLFDIETPREFHTITPGLFGHFKDTRNTYNIIAVARNSETGEWCVAYQPLYGVHRYQFRHRPLENFREHVEKPEYNYSGPRFFQIDVYRHPRIAAEYQD